MSAMHAFVSPSFHPRRLSRSAGIGLVTAIFLLVILAGMGVAAVRIFNAQQAGSTLDLDGARAYQAARAGIEWGLFQRLRKDSCAGTTSFALPADSVLASFTVSVSCSVVAGLPDADGNTVATTGWIIRAVACNQPIGGECKADDGGGNAMGNSPDFVQRRLEVQL